MSKFIFEDYLKEQLNICKAQLELDDYKILVSSERSFKFPDDTNTILIVIKELAGNYVHGIKTQPVQITCYSERDTVLAAKNILELFTQTHQNEQFKQGSLLIKQTYNSVAFLRPMIQEDIGYRASLYCYGNYVVCDNLRDIENIEVYNPDEEEWIEVKPISAGLAYGAVLNTTKVAGQELSKSLKQEAGLTITMSFLNDNSYFVDLINSVMTGRLSGNFDFNIRFNWNNSVVKEELPMKLDNASLTTSETDAPALQVVLRR